MLNNLKLIDLTQTMYPGMPEWPDKISFQHSVHMTYHQGAHISNLQMCTGTGTHIDSPGHLIKGGRFIDKLDVSELLSPAVVINIVSQVNQNPDYGLAVSDLKSWENQYGPIPKNAMVLARTDWSLRWHDIKSYSNFGDDELMHFPGFSAESAEYLLEKQICGIGIDTYSLDCGISQDFPVHKLILGKDKYQIENLTNLALLPEKGAFILACPLKIKDAPEAPARVIGFINE